MILGVSPEPSRAVAMGDLPVSVHSRFPMQSAPQPTSPFTVLLPPSFLHTLLVGLPLGISPITMDSVPDLL